MSKYAFVFNLPLAYESFVCPLLSPQAEQNKILRGRAPSNSLLEDDFLDSCQCPLSTGFLDAFSIWLSKHLAATLFPNILTSCGICGWYSYFQGSNWPVNPMKSYISIFSLLERVPPPAGDCGLYCEIGVIITAEILAVQWFPAEFSFFFFFFFWSVFFPPYHATCFENERHLHLILYSQGISDFPGITPSTPSILQGHS